MVSIEGENMRPVTWCVIEEVRSGDWGIGGNPLTTARREEPRRRATSDGVAEANLPRRRHRGHGQRSARLDQTIDDLRVPGAHIADHDRHVW
jgi:hypothetical protein